MLGSLGFFIAAIVLILFAYTFNQLIRKTDQSLRLFGVGYLLIALAFVMWAMLSFADAQAMLAHSILLGDILFLAATTCAVLVVTPKKWQMLVVIAAAAITVVFMYIRVTYFYPNPFFLGGVLYFNIQHSVAILLSVALLGWLPACMKVARRVTTLKGLEGYYPIYVTAYAVSIITAALFLQAQRRLIIITSFIAFGVSVLLLLMSNLIALNMETVKVNKHGRK